MAKLTDLAVRNAKPKAARYERSDNGSGLLLIVQPSGHKSFVTRTRLNGLPIKVTHGDAGALSLADARIRNAEAIKQAKQGIGPRDAKKVAKAKRQIAEANSFEAIAQLYLDTEGQEASHRQSSPRPIGTSGVPVTRWQARRGHQAQ